jgi:hypothetical protein
MKYGTTMKKVQTPLNTIKFTSSAPDVLSSSMAVKNQCELGEKLCGYTNRVQPDQEQ